MYSKILRKKSSITTVFVVSTSCSSGKMGFLPLPRMFQWHSISPTIENVQWEPQLPWFFTSVTIPRLFHSQALGILVIWTCCLLWDDDWRSNSALLWVAGRRIPRISSRSRRWSPVSTAIFWDCAFGYPARIPSRIISYVFILDRLSF